jgi:RNA polymerase sigma-70 factor (ECF subfamily)
MENDELQLVTSCQKGQYENFGLLYDKYVKKIYDFVFYRTLHKETAEDITSKVFIKALENIGSFKPEKAAFNTWLYQIARNSIIDHFRTHKPSGELDESLNLASSENLENQTHAKLELEKVKKYLNTLDPSVREIVVMRVWDGLSFKEIGEVVGKSEAASKMAFGRVMEKLSREVAFAALYLLFLKP